MPDFPRTGGGATAAEVWGYGTRNLSNDAANAIRDAILSDATLIPGGNIDAAISGRAPISEYDTEMARITAPVATEAKQDIVDGVVDDIKLKTENLPASPAPASEYDTELAHLDVDVSSRPDGAEFTPARAAKMDKIQDFAEEASGTLTATGAEDTIKEITATVNKLHCFIDLTNMASATVIKVRQYMTIKAAGSPVLYAEEEFSAVQTLPMLYIVTKPARYGIKITLEQTSGTPFQDYDWETFQEKAA